MPGDILERLANFGSVYLLDTVRSTNDYALALAAHHRRAIVIADIQTGGRGRFRRHWFSDRDSLTASFLLHADEIASPDPKYVTPTAGLAAAIAIERVTGVKVQIRWPNDIIHQQRKLAGLLCESRRRAVVIGLGVNVNQRSFPSELPQAISLRQATGHDWDRFALLEAFVTEADTLLRQASTDFAPLLMQIRQRSATINRRVEVTTLLRRHVGTVIDLDPECRIVLRTDSGRLVVLGLGQVRNLQ